MHTINRGRYGPGQDHAVLRLPGGHAGQRPGGQGAGCGAQDPAGALETGAGHLRPLQADARVLWDQPVRQVWSPCKFAARNGGLCWHAAKKAAGQGTKESRLACTRDDALRTVLRRRGVLLTTYGKRSRMPLKACSVNALVFRHAELLTFTQVSVYIKTLWKSRGRSTVRRHGTAQLQLPASAWRRRTGR